MFWAEGLKNIEKYNYNYSKRRNYSEPPLFKDEIRVT